MKRYLVLLLAVYANVFVAQTSIGMFLGTSSLTPMSTGTNISVGVLPNSEKISFFRLQNLAATTQSFGLNRKFIVETPTLCVDDNNAVTPYTYICFATTCEGPSCDSITPDKHAVLGPMGSTVAPFDNTTDNSMYFKIYMDEGPTSGYYVVEYTVYNATTPSDKFVFTITYNSPQSVKENNITKDRFDPYFSAPEQKLYPNIKGEFAQGSKLVVSEITGKKVFECKISELQTYLDCTKLNEGIYTITVSENNSSTTKKVLITK